MMVALTILKQSRMFSQRYNILTSSCRQGVLNPYLQYAGCKVIFFDAGVYIVTSTITIPAGTQIVGEAWSVIQGSGNAFTDYNNPQVVVRVGDAGSTGLVEISDMIFSTKGPGMSFLPRYSRLTINILKCRSAAGAIVVEWNIRDPAGQQGVAGAWNSHIVYAPSLNCERGPPLTAISQSWRLYVYHVHLSQLTKLRPYPQILGLTCLMLNVQN